MQSRAQHLRRGTLAATVMLALGPATASAAGFQLLEQGAKGQGTSFSGTATNWQDPATAYWNPAGMARHTERSIAVVGSVVDVKFDFEDDGSSLVDTGGLPFNDVPGASAEETTDAGETAFVPNLYYVQPLRGDWTFGFAINAPYGLESDYDPEWVGRYHAINSELVTINLNPSIAYRLSDSVSVGAGINVQYAEATLTSRVDPTAASGGAFGTRGDPDDDTDAEIEGDNWGAGINFGVLADITPRTRMGIAYRGHVTHSVDADASFNHRNSNFETLFAEPNNVFVDTDAAATLDMPETLTVSVARDSTRLQDVTIMSDITWTRWSRLDELKIEFDSDQSDSVEELEFKNTMRVTLGATWDVTPAWQLRTGIAYDESPTRDSASRSPRIPDNDRRWLSFGVGYSAPGSDFEVDAGYSRLFISDTRIERTNAFDDELRGDYESSVDIVAVQGSWRF